MKIQRWGLRWGEVRLGGGGDGEWALCGGIIWEVDWELRGERSLGRIWGTEWSLGNFLAILWDFGKFW